jgi:hypothetical protein
MKNVQTKLEGTTLVFRIPVRFQRRGGRCSLPQAELARGRGMERPNPYRGFESLPLRQLSMAVTVSLAVASRLRPLETKGFSVLSC